MTERTKRICYNYLCYLWDYANDKQRNAIIEIKKMMNEKEQEE